MDKKISKNNHRQDIIIAQLKQEFLDFKKYVNEKFEWLVEYNFRRPHEALGYQTPMKFSNVLPMYSSCT